MKRTGRGFPEAPVHIARGTGPDPVTRKIGKHRNIKAQEKINVKIITINLPDAYVEALEKLCAELGVYPSRSEAIRTALRQFVNKELDNAAAIQKLNELKVKRATLLQF